MRYWKDVFTLSFSYNKIKYLHRLLDEEAGGGGGSDKLVCKRIS